MTEERVVPTHTQFRGHSVAVGTFEPPPAPNSCIRLARSLAAVQFRKRACRPGFTSGQKWSQSHSLVAARASVGTSGPELPSAIVTQLVRRKHVLVSLESSVSESSVIVFKNALGKVASRSAPAPRIERSTTRMADL